uniref:SCP domain-containing protein n=1 Tax=Mesocestoides corti TaxID=53468 RepID=A0A5K3EME6_MESCO
MLRVIHLLLLTWHAFARVPSPKDRKTIIECHTKLREEVKPPANNMQLLSYSMELEKLANDIIYYCNNGYPKDFLRGQQVEYFEMDFRDRAPQYSDLCKINTSITAYGKEGCLTDCFIYLHMINSETTEVGCSYGICHNKFPLVHNPEYIVCVYRPMKPITFKSKPYEPGISCMKCPSGYECHRNQCRKNSFIIKQLQFPECIAKLSS